MQPQPEDFINAALFLGADSSPEIVELLSPQDFVGGHRRRFFERAADLVRKKEAVADWTINPEQDHKFNEYITELYGISFHVGLNECITALRRRGLKTKARKVLAEHLQRLDKELEPEDVLNELTSEISKLTQTTGGGPIQFAEAGRQALEFAGHLQTGEAQIVKTGFDVYDNKYGGFMEHELIVLAGAGGMGKTSLALAIASHVAQTQPVYFINMEMGEQALAARKISADLGISGTVFRGQEIFPEVVDNIYKYLENRRDLKLWIERGVRATPDKIYSKARKHKAKHGLGLLVVDYYQRLTSSTKGLTREQQLSEISREMKELTGKLGCPILLVAATNRDIKSRVDKRPIISDIRECGQLEFDADSIAFIHRPAYYGEGQDKDLCELITRKHRSGPENVSLRLKFDSAYTRFSEYVDPDGKGWIG